MLPTPFLLFLLFLVDRIDLFTIYVYSYLVLQNLITQFYIRAGCNLLRKNPETPQGW